MRPSPMIDIVFKMLFSSQDSEQELVSLLNAVIKPKEPIISAKVLNPNIPKEFFEEHGVIVDILAELSDGTKVDTLISITKLPALTYKIYLPRPTPP